MPRHPPCALNYLTTNTTQNKMLASTMQHSTHHHTPTHPQPPPHPTTHQQQVTDALDSPSQEQPEKNTPPTGVSSGPNSVPNPSPKTESFPGKSLCVPPSPRTPTTDTKVYEKRSIPYSRAEALISEMSPSHSGRLLRKEVIQPHLPVRLPCYDFVPIAGPTFDHSPPQVGWAMGFGCYQLS
jgi:hypothetical protein